MPSLYAKLLSSAMILCIFGLWKIKGFTRFVLQALLLSTSILWPNYHRGDWTGLQGIYQSERTCCSQNGKWYQTYCSRDWCSIVISLALFLTSDFETLAKEVSTVLSFKHVNVLSLIGVCIDGETPLLIMPFMSNGSVLDYVRNHRNKLLIDQFEEKV